MIAVTWVSVACDCAHSLCKKGDLLWRQYRLWRSGPPFCGL